jgi:hypothetical protein
MNRYHGNPEQDVPLRGGSFTDEYGYGFEVFNFQPDSNGVVYGFVEAPGSLQLWRIHAHAHIKVDEVLVVWCANDDEDSLRIVGWYENATVYSTAQECPPHLVPERILPDSTDEWEYRCKAPANACVLLRPKERVFRVPKALSDGMGFGRYAVWYADTDDAKHKEFRRKVLDYIRDVSEKRGLTQSERAVRHGARGDTERKQEVEKAAIEAAMRCYLDEHWQVTDVSAEKRGWDLEARRLGQLLRLEVKGLSGSTIGIELTPGEYEAMKAFSPDSYRLCVVVNALEPSKTLLKLVYRGSAELEHESDSLQKFSIEDRTGARIRATR